MPYWKTPEFKALQKAWYQRLEDEGFSDAEEMVGGEMLLKEYSASRRESAPRAENDLEYYMVVAQKVQETEFRRDIDRVIMVAHAEGKKACDICDELKERGTPRFRHTVRFTVRRYEAMWGIRDWTPRQLGKKVG